MTTTTIVHDEIRRFLESSEPEVLCLTGAWGVGKTFTWKRFLLEAKDSKRIGLEKYAYVSLFGQNSLDDVRNTIVEETTPISAIGAAIDFSSLKAATKTAGARWRWAANQLRGFATEYLPETLSGRWLFMSVRKQIICIDDLERCGSSLERKDVLGLISFLKEERDCKVVLLLNQEKLGEHKDEFQVFLEKVVDTRLEYAPTPIEAADIGLTSKGAVKEQLSANFIKLGVTNIRVIRKVEHLAKRLLELLPTQDVDVVRQALHSTVFFGWMYYQPQEAPPLTYVTSYNPWKHLEEDKPSPDFLGEDDKPTSHQSAQESSWRAQISSYGLTSVDEFDKVIIDGIGSGAFDPKAVAVEASGMLGRIERERLDNSFTEAWRLYRTSFNVSADEVLIPMKAAFKKAVTTITPMNLNITIQLFKSLGREDDAKELLKFYVGARANEGPKLFDLESYPFAGDIKDTDVRDAFNAAAAIGKADTPFDPVAVLAGMSQGWNSEDVARLAKLSVEDFYKLFKASEGENLLSIIRQALKLGSYGNSSDDMGNITAKARSALMMIAAESDINRYKVKNYFGIELADRANGGEGVVD